MTNLDLLKRMRWLGAINVSRKEEIDALDWAIAKLDASKGIQSGVADQGCDGRRYGWLRIFLRFIGL